MDTIKAIIVDDEKNNRITLLKLIEKFWNKVCSSEIRLYICTAISQKALETEKVV